MSRFGNLTNEGLEESQDRVGSDYSARETDIYSGEVKLAYQITSAGGAMGITLLLALEDGKDYRETVYVTNKRGENWFPAKDANGKPTGKRSPLPGFTVIDDLCIICTDKPLAEQNAEDKMVNVYDSQLKKEVTKSVPVLVDLLGSKISVAIAKTLENKNEKQGNEYVPTAETREVNNIEKVLDTESHLTVVEVRDALVEKREPVSEFWDKWLERNKGKTRDKRTVKDGAGTAGRPGSRAPNTPPVSNGAGPAPAKSLFGNRNK